MKLFIVLIALVGLASATLSNSQLQVQYAAAKAAFGKQLTSSTTDDKEHFLSFKVRYNGVGEGPLP